MMPLGYKRICIKYSFLQRICSQRPIRYLAHVSPYPRNNSSSCQRRLVSSNVELHHKQQRGSTKANKDRNGTIIYLRNSKENRIPRGNIAFCCVHSLYWGWYAEQCVSSVMASVPVPFYVHPSAGLYGLTFAMVLNFAFYTYARLLVSKIIFNNVTGKVQVYCHNLPWLTPATKPMEFNVGDICLDRNKAEVIYLLEKLGGDATQFRGHLPLRVLRADGNNKLSWPLLVYCNDSYVIKDNDLFLQALLFDMSSDDNEDDVGLGDDSFKETTGMAKRQSQIRSVRMKVGKTRRNR